MIPFPVPPPNLIPQTTAVSEQRQLTVLSDALPQTEPLDSENLYDLMQTFRDTTRAIVMVHGGIEMAPGQALTIDIA